MRYCTYSWVNQIFQYVTCIIFKYGTGLCSGSVLSSSWRNDPQCSYPPIFSTIFLRRLIISPGGGGLYGANVQLLDLTVSLIIVLKETNIYLFPNNITIFGTVSSFEDLNYSWVSTIPYTIFIILLFYYLLKSQTINITPCLSYSPCN